MGFRPVNYRQERDRKLGDTPWHDRLGPRALWVAEFSMRPLSYMVCGI